MKFFTLPVAFILITCGITSAQNLMPDSSFENWHTGKYGYLNPDGCDTTFITNSNYYNLYDSASVLRIDAAHTGAYALKIATVYMDTPVKKYEGGYIDFFFPINYAPQYLSGWWIGNEGSVAGTQGAASVSIYDSSGTSVIGGCTVNTPGDTAKWSTYKNFTGYITYISGSATAKYCELKLYLTSLENDSIPWVAFDDISVNTVEGINVIPGANYNLQVYPNPTTTVAQVNYNLKSGGNVQFTLTDILGRTIKIVQNGYQPQGNYNLAVDCSTLPPGLYLCKLSAPSDYEVSKVLVTRH